MVFGGIYTVKVKARCSIHTYIESEWSDELTVKIEIVSTPATPTVPPPTPPPPPWVLGTTYTFSASGSISTLSHPIQYMFDWGDSTYSNWIDAGTGGTATATHFWNMAGTYQVRVQARCKTHPTVFSDFSNVLTVTIP